MKKLLMILLAACCVWAAWDYTRPVDRYVVKATAGEGDTLGTWWAIQCNAKAIAEIFARSSFTPNRLVILPATCSRVTSC